MTEYTIWRERSRAIPTSSLHAIHRLASERGKDTIALHVGEPHIGMPESAADAFVRAIRDRQTYYTDAPGLPMLREALADRLAGNGAPRVGQVFVTPGSCQAISAVLQSIAIDGGIALLPELHWPIHLQQVLATGLTPRFFHAAHPGLSPVESLEAGYEPAVCAVIINSPSNPAGVVLDQHVIADIHEWAVRHHVWLISDEAYEDFVYAGEPPRTAALDTPLAEAERVVFSVHTFSKGFSMTGCRLGYVTAPSADRADLLQRVQEATLIAPSTPVQFAGLAALNEDQHLAAHHGYVRATRDDAAGALVSAGLLRAMPEGGWYALIDLGRHAADSGVFCRQLLHQAGVALTPGHDFLPAGHAQGRSLARLALCGERAATMEGVRRLLTQLEADPFR
ncbi:MAG: pyridoxal phosphate-dependent aminotransferase [Streptosporangiaceae bacterium]